MDPETPSFDLATWVADSMPALLAAESDDAWRHGFSEGRDVRQPVSALAAPEHPVQVFLRSDEQPPEGLDRAERAEFFAARDAAQQAAVQAAQDAAQDHAYWVQLQGQRRAVDALDVLLSGAAKARQEREDGATQIPVRGADQPATGGRW